MNESDADDDGATAWKKLALRDAWVRGDVDEADRIWEETWELKVEQGVAWRVIERDKGRRPIYKGNTTALEDPFLHSWSIWRWCHPSTPFNPEHLWIESTALMEIWQRWAGVGIGLDCETRKVEVKTHTLFAGLVWQVMAAFGHSGGFAVCVCGETYTPQRNQQCCDDCRTNRKREKARNRQRRRRVRLERIKKMANTSLDETQRHFNQ